MIRQLSGTIIHKDDSSVILDTGGVGYKVFVADDTNEALAAAEAASVTLWTHLAVRENAMDLYGFLSPKELDFFEMMIGISGIGPKKAMSIISAAGFQTIHKAIRAGDSSFLQKIPGVGRKNAEKILMELSDKLSRDEESGAVIKEELDAHEALKALGYSFKEAKEALALIPATARGTSERVREALKVMGRQ
ncbi:MAG: Holliday junction branch migration protein RuvA [Parcubacteria group bacterium]|nr:Holliday junction branch migration protein RuvA [Parcubacteria group bacterium]